MKQSKAKMRGYSILGIFLGGILLAFFVMIGIKLFPIYLDNHQVQESLNLLVNEKDIVLQPKSVIRDWFSRRLYANSIKYIDVSKLDIKVENNKLHLKIHYETRVPLISNIDAVLTFDNEATST